MITIADTGPLVAYFNRRDPLHGWAVELMRRTRSPMLTCDAVLTETAYFLCEDKLSVEPLFQMLERGSLVIDFDLASHWPRVRTLMSRYEQMDLADGCIVAMTELHSRCQVLTIDATDFGTYRRHDRRVIEFIAPLR